MWRLTTEWQKQQRKALSTFKLTHVQFVFLACLKWLETHMDTNITQHQISALSRIDKMVVSETKRQLLQKGLITSSQHPLDKRAYAVNLTDPGDQLVQQALPIVESVDIAFFRDNQARINRLNAVVDAL